MTHVRFYWSDGTLAAEGDATDERLLDLAQTLDMPLEGTCGGVMACSTCHVIVSEKDYGKLPPPSASEEDMLDFAPCVVPTSRLSCQVHLSAALDTLDVTLPDEHQDMR